MHITARKMLKKKENMKNHKICYGATHNTLYCSDNVFFP